MHSCLLIVDVQDGFINEYTDHIPNLVEIEQNKYQHIYVTQFFNPLHSPYRRLLGWQEMGKDSKGFGLAFTPIKRAIVFQKSIYSSVRPSFLNELKNKKISCVDICGIDTDACVLKTAVDLSYAKGTMQSVRKHWGH